MTRGQKNMKKINVTSNIKSSSYKTRLMNDTLAVASFYSF